MHRLNTYKLSALAAATLVCAVGCNDDASDRGESGALATIADPDDAEAGDAGSVDGGSSDAGTPVIDGGIDGGVVPNPNSPYFVSVTANGSGCSADTSTTSIAPSGDSFWTTFSAYEVSINKDTPDLTVTSNCILSVKVHAPAGISFAVTSFRIAGYTFLEQGVSATMSAYYRFQGSAVTPNSNRITKVGPLDDDFVYYDDVKTTDLAWSPCGVDRELIVTTQLQLRNASPKRSGYANIKELPLQGGLKLAFQPCTASKPPPVAPGKGSAVSASNH